MELRGTVSRDAPHDSALHHRSGLDGFPLVGRYSLVAQTIVYGQSNFALVSICVVSLVCVPLPWRTAVTFPETFIHLGTNPCPPQPPQILLRLAHIPSDLLSQSLDRWELDFVAQAIEEVNLNFGFR